MVAKDIIDVVKGILTSGQAPKQSEPTGSATTAASIYQPPDTGTFANLTLSARRFSPAALVLPDVYTSDDPLRAGGVDEILSVEQIAGAPGGGAPTQTRTFQVRGTVIA